MISKLFKLKEWLTLDEAVNHISNVLGEPISQCDIYKLALDGHLKLSIMFMNGAKAKRVRLVKTEDVEYIKFIPKIPNFPNGRCFHVPQNVGIQISKDYWIHKVELEMIHIGGIWDLAMIGAEQADIANRYHKETSGCTVKIPSLIGHYLQRNGEFYQLQVRQEPVLESIKHNYHTVHNAQEENEEPNLQDIRLKLKRPYRPPQYMMASKLHDCDHTLVLRTSEINRFIQSLEDTPIQNKVLTTNEKNSLLVLIAALCKQVSTDWNQRGLSASLVAMTDLIGAPLSDETIRKILKQIDSAIDSRSK